MQSIKSSARFFCFFLYVWQEWREPVTLWGCLDHKTRSRQAGRQAELRREYLENRQMDKWGYTQLIRCTTNSKPDVSCQNSPLSHTEGLWVATLLWCVSIFFQWELKVALAEKCDICNAVRALMLVGFSAPPTCRTKVAVWNDSSFSFGVNRW